MVKKVAVLVPNPVNGSGLFQYLEAFFENGISFKTFAMAESVNVKTNSGVSLQTDDVVANLKGHENEYNALVFACGDAVPTLAENAAKQYQDTITVIRNFGNSGKLLAGHCAAALLFDNAGVAQGKQVALHPYIKQIVKNCKGTDSKFVVDGNLYTAQTENTIPQLIPFLLKALKG
ncbi:MAG: DJ-1/PfpI family protein [Prevotellaceae bacterium]|nr:DJ-1/PfpI family protein [Prevotellaceae bacterium]